jgi:hypothetical protein
MRPPRLRWLEYKDCVVDGCGAQAPGTNPLCREHRKQVDAGAYANLRFVATDEILDAVLKSLEAT